MIRHFFAMLSASSHYLSRTNLDRFPKLVYDELVFQNQFPKTDMRYQMEFRLSSLMQSLGMDVKAVANELGINPAHVARLCEDNWATIQRPDLQKLLCWAQKHGQAELLSVVPNPAWRTLSNSEVVLFRGRTRDGNPLHSDSNVERELIVALEDEGCRITPRSIEMPDHAQIVAWMRTTNCIFIGSPKLNAASESALAALWDVEPRRATASNRRLSPLQFVWEPGYAGCSAFGRPKADGETIGLHVGVRNTDGIVQRRFPVPVDWKPADRYAKWTGKGRDAGAMVVCYQPLGTTNEVTTIVLAGHSGFATVDMATDLVRDELRYEARELRPHAVSMRVLATSYVKKSARGDSRSRITKGRRWYGLPWSELEGLSKKQPNP